MLRNMHSNIGLLRPRVETTRLFFLTICRSGCGFYSDVIK